MKDSRLSRALCFECPPVPGAEPDAQSMVHYLLNEGMDGGVEGKTHMDIFFNTNQETSRAAFYIYGRLAPHVPPWQGSLTKSESLKGIL